MEFVLKSTFVVLRWFYQIFMILVIFGLCKGPIFQFVGLGNRQSPKKIFETSAKLSGDNFWYPEERYMIKNEWYFSI